MSWTPTATGLGGGGGGGGGALPAPGADGEVLTASGGAWMSQTNSNAPISSLPVLTEEDGANDWLRIHDTSANAEKRITVNDLMSA